MNAKDWKVGDLVRRKTPYRVLGTPHGELCRVKSVSSIAGSKDTVIIVVGNRTTGNPVSRVEKHYEWVSREESV